MLREIPNIRQNGEHTRRWFHDEVFDLFVWEDNAGAIVKLQLCSRLTDQETAITWDADAGVSYHRVDSGENSPLANRTPILIPDDKPDKGEIQARFAEAAASLDAAVTGLVIKILSSSDSG